MRYSDKNSPWISSLRGIDQAGRKWEYEEAQKHWFRFICVLFTGAYGFMDGSF